MLYDPSVEGALLALSETVKGSRALLELAVDLLERVERGEPFPAAFLEDRKRQVATVRHQLDELEKKLAFFAVLEAGQKRPMH
jgi:hypothetical protein